MEGFSLRRLKIEAARMKQLDAKATQTEVKDYKSIVGSLQWLIVQSCSIGSNRSLLSSAIPEADLRSTHRRSD